MRFFNKSDLFILMVIVSFLCLNGKTFAQSDGLVLEWEQHWETYGVGGTCIAGTHNFFVGDVDEDAMMEIITGGFMYNVANDTRVSSEAPLKIWNWNGEKFTIEASQTWSGSIRSIYAADADDDGLTEIITGGSIRNSTGNYASLRIWSWNGDILVLRDSYEGISVSSIFVSDLDKDGAPEILTVGSVSNDAKSSAQLSIWQWDGKNLDLKKSIEWCALNDSRANSVYAYDLNNDKYLSDAGGKNLIDSQGRHLLEEISNTKQGQVVQVLIHPDWWY